MEIIKDISKLQEVLQKKRGEGTIGFVPTMGALHDGHLSLVSESSRNNACTVVSVYVNPTQFNNKEDLKKYPRDLIADCKMLETTGCCIVFAPDDKEMYPKPDTRKFDFGAIEKVMEGRYRPGHFIGVGQIVSKLFDIVQPDRAYFGLKDFQQLAVIKRLVKICDYTIEIIPCAIIREEDGLAMSSRNILLDKDRRQNASLIYHTLQEVKNKMSNFSVEQAKKFVASTFEKNKYFELEYFEIVDDENLQPIRKILGEEPCTACIAVYAGNVRLIDNMQLNS